MLEDSKSTERRYDEISVKILKLNSPFLRSPLNYICNGLSVQGQELFIFVKWRIQSCNGQLLSGVKDTWAGQMSWRSETHTHTPTHTPHTHSLPTITDHPTAAVLNTMSQLCDGIECRLTARTGGSAKGEILAVELGKEQTDRVKT